MTLNNFSVRVFTLSNKDKVLQIPRESNQYVYLVHGKQYFIRIRNRFKTDAIATLYIDGQSMGKYIVPAVEKLDIYSPINDTGKFTFYEADSKESSLCNLDKVDKKDLGVISVNLIPLKPDAIPTEKELQTILFYGYHAFNCQCTNCRPQIPYAPTSPLYPTITYSANLINAVSSTNIAESSIMHSLGGTGLTGDSSKEYIAPGENSILDYDNETEIHLRLLSSKFKDNKPRPKSAKYITLIPTTI